MIMPRNAPLGSYIDDPADNIDHAANNLDHADAAESQRDLAYAISSDGLRFVAEWITRGRNDPKQRAMRSDVFLLCIHPDFLPCKRRPSAAWVARQHGVSRERIRILRNEFRDAIAPYIKFSGQRSRPQPHACSERRSGSPARSLAHSPPFSAAAVP
jgi:hypothetical protein